ncbi:MFS transporter [Candidatus Woesearchaeota archaeon]|nr:MFS transporter [Candidatus Woesearchaeota archaeon]
MVFKKDELRLLWPYYLAAFLFGASMLIAPFLIIYLRDLGFSFLKIELIFAIILVAVFFFEIPTGAFADLHGRKLSTLLGYLLIGFASLAIYFVEGHILFFLCWALFGLAQTFISGAEEAWIVDYLKFNKRKDLVHEYFMKVASIIGVGFIISPLIAGILVEYYSIRLLWMIQAFGFFSGAVILFIFAHEHFKKKRIKITKSVKETIKITKTSINYSLKHKVLLLLIIAGVFAGLTRIGFDGWQPALVNLGLPVAQLGYLFSAVGVVTVISPFLSKYFMKKFKSKYSLILLVGLESMFYLMLLLIYPPLFYYAALIFLLTNGFVGIRKPIENTYFQKFIPSKIRATVTSCTRMASSLFIGIAAIGAGYLMDILTPKIVIALGGLFCIPAIIFYLKIKEK